MKLIEEVIRDAANEMSLAVWELTPEDAGQFNVLASTKPMPAVAHLARKSGAFVGEYAGGKRYLAYRDLTLYFLGRPADSTAPSREAALAGLIDLATAFIQSLERQDAWRRVPSNTSILPTFEYDHIVMDARLAQLSITFSITIDAPLNRFCP